MNLWLCLPVEIINHKHSDSGDKQYCGDNCSRFFIINIQLDGKTEGDGSVNNQLDNKKGYMYNIVGWMVPWGWCVQVG